MSQNYEYFGKYILLEKLATGGMAEVWLARAQGAGGIGKFVAIKKILPQFSDNPEFIQMFKDEAAIAMNLSHSNIVSIYEFGQEANQLFLVMDYVEGRNLRQILNKMKQTSAKFSIDQIIYMVREVAAGLDHAHRSLNSATGKPLNITHRDMSPQNVMITFEGEVKIVDFGIAKAESQMETTRTGTLKGKFGYMSPEQAEGLPTDLRTDVFSLGIVLWELLANDRLFIANNEINTLKKIRECSVPPLTKINPNIHPELERIAMKALTRDRNLRYQTGAAFHRDLSRFLNRQYPDFSPQDFAVYIKTMYTDEILELRKRLVDYSKIPLRTNVVQGSQNTMDENTIVSGANMDPHSSSSGAIQKTGESMVTDPALVPTDTFSDESKPSQSLSSAPKGFTQPLEKENMGSPSSVSISRIDPNDPKNSGIIIQADHQTNLLDGASLQKNLKQRITINPRMPKADHLFEVDRISSSDPSPLARFKRNRAKNSQNSSKNSNAVLNIFIIAAFAVGTYFVGDSLFPNEIDDVRTIIRGFFDLASNIKNDKSSPEETTKSTTLTSPTGIDKPNNIVQRPEEISENGIRPIIVNSEPSGAEIFIDGKSTGKLTPARIEIPTKKLFNLTLKKERFLDYNTAILNAEKIGPSFSAQLQESAIAYINIDVKPPSSNVRITVNNKSIKDLTFPIMQYIVAAKTEVQVTAINISTGEEIKKTIRAQPNQSVEVLFQFRRERVPSSH